MTPYKTNSRTGLSRQLPLRSQQQGISILFVLFIAVLVFIVGGAGLRLLPTFIEYRSITAAIDRAVVDEAGEPAAIRRSFDRAAAIDDIASISGKDLLIEEVNGKTVVNFEYERRVPLVGPVSLVVDYRRNLLGK